MQDRIAQGKSDDKADHETVDRPQQMGAQILDVLAERHERIGKHVVGIRIVGLTPLHGEENNTPADSLVDRQNSRTINLTNANAASQLNQCYNRASDPQRVTYPFC